MADQIEQAQAEVFRIEHVSRLPRSVETTAKNIENQFPITIEALEHTANALRERAEALEQKANYLRDQLVLAEDIRRAVKHERDFWDEVMSLALVQERPREEVL